MARRNTGPLSAELMEALAPALGELARAIGRDGEPRADELELLLLGAQVDDPAAATEFGLWSRILCRLLNGSGERQRNTVAAALRLRGLSEAQIILAIDAVCRASAESAPAASPEPEFTGWTVWPEFLNLGLLAPKQGAIATLQINGPAGEAVGEPSSRVKVIPARFPAGETTLTVQVSGGSAGSLIWGSVFLRQGSQEQEVPVSAEWAVPAEPEPVAPAAPEPTSAGAPADEEARLRQELADREARLGPNNLDVALSLNGLAVTLHNSGRYADAEPLYRRALKIRETQLGPDHLDVAQSLNELAVTLHNSGRYADAEPLYRRALKIRETQLGPDHLDVAQSLYNLGSTLHRLERYAEAEPLHRRALQIREKRLGPNHLDVAGSLNELAVTLPNSGRNAEAEPLHRRALQIREKRLGPDHLDVAGSLNELAWTLGELGCDTEAEPLLRRALQICEKHFGLDHLEVASSADDLALTLFRLERYAEAEPLHRRALQIREKQLGPDHLDVALSLDNLGFALWGLERYAEAEPLLRRALQICEKHFGLDHLEVASSADDLALTLFRLERYSDAEPLYRRALKIRETQLGTDHLDVARSLDNLGNTLERLERYAEAEPLHRRALQIREKRLGPDHLDVAWSLNELAWTLGELGRDTEAEPLCRRALQIREVQLGPDHLEVASSADDLALTLFRLKRFAEAEPLHRRALKIRETQLGPDHLDVASSAADLALTLFLLERYAEAEPLYRRSLAIIGSATQRGEPEPEWATTVRSNHADCLSRLGRSKTTSGAKTTAQPAAPALTPLPANWPSYLSQYQPVPGMQYRVHGPDQMPQVLIPAGEFLMGSPANEPNRSTDEGPQKRVFVSAFWMDLHEVTNEQYAGFVRATGHQASKDWAKWSRATSPRHPAVYVNWEEASAYAAWAGRELPTEAQWEKAARGGTTTAYYWGASPNPSLANGNWERNRKYSFENAVNYVKPVGSYLPNPYGQLDMTGNVWEWCRDWYAEDWHARMGNRDPLNTTQGNARSCRGGSWYFYPQTLRVACRNRGTPGVRGLILGFRCVGAAR